MKESGLVFGMAFAEQNLVMSSAQIEEQTFFNWAGILPVAEAKIVAKNPRKGVAATIEVPALPPVLFLYL